MSPQLLFAFAPTEENPPSGQSIGDETRQCIATLGSALKAQGVTLADVLTATIYLSPGTHGEVWAAWDEAFAHAEVRPMRLTQVAGLPAGVRVGIDAVAQTSGKEEN